MKPKLNGDTSVSKGERFVLRNGAPGQSKQARAEQYWTWRHAHPNNDHR